MSRFKNSARLGAAYAVHQLRRRRRRSLQSDLIGAYEAGVVVPLQPVERGRIPSMSGCISCGLCSVAADVREAAALSDLVPAYLLRVPPSGASLAAGQQDGPQLDLAARSCPVGVPIPEVAALLRGVGE